MKPILSIAVALLVTAYAGAGGYYQQQVFAAPPVLAVQGPSCYQQQAPVQVLQQRFYEQPVPTFVPIQVVTQRQFYSAPAPVLAQSGYGVGVSRSFNFSSFRANRGFSFRSRSVGIGGRSFQLRQRTVIRER